MTDFSRRDVLKLTLLASTAVLTTAVSAPTNAADLPALTETDPVGAALGYKEASSKVDVKKYPNFKPDQYCNNCKLIQGDAKSLRRPCSIFPGKSVAAKGWCAAYVKL